MRVGDLNKRVRIQYPAESQGVEGEITFVFADLEEVWAAIEPLSGREFYAAQQIQSEVNTKITLRYNPRVTPKMRVLYATLSGSPTEYDVYEVMSVVHLKQGRRVTELMCVNRLATGFRSGGSNA